jgi:hypothetical protein
MRPPPLATEETQRLGQEFLKRFGEWEKAEDRLNEALVGTAPDVKTGTCRGSCLEKVYAERDAKMRESFDFLQGVMQQHGWVSSAAWGKDVEQAAARLAMARFTNLKKSAATDDDIVFMKGLLPQLRERVTARGVYPGNYARMVDDIELYEGRSQVFGSRFECVDGAFVPPSLLEPERVNERRAGLGLGPIEEDEFGTRVKMQAYCAMKAGKPAPVPQPVSPQQQAASDERVKLGKQLLKLFTEWTVLHDHAGDVMRGKAPEPTPQSCRTNCLDEAVAEAEAKKVEAFDFLRGIVQERGWISYPAWSREVETTGLTVLALQFTSLTKTPAMDDAVAFVKSLLPVLLDRVTARRVGVETYASIVDGVELYEGRQQIYGSRFECVDGKYAPVSVLAPERLNERRASLWLEPIEEHMFSQSASMQAYCARQQAKAKDPAN